MALRRDGAKADDDIWVSGQPGLAALGLAQHRADDTTEALAKLLRGPESARLPRLEWAEIRWRRRIDLSMARLPTRPILKRSGLAAQLNVQFPLTRRAASWAMRAKRNWAAATTTNCASPPHRRRQQVVMRRRTRPAALAHRYTSASDERLNRRHPAHRRRRQAPPLPESGFDHWLGQETIPPAPGFLPPPGAMTPAAWQRSVAVGTGTIGTLFALFLPDPETRPGSTTSASPCSLVARYVGGVMPATETGQALGEPDHGSIVWDDQALLADALFSPEGWLWWIVAFFLRFLRHRQTLPGQPVRPDQERLRGDD